MDRDERGDYGWPAIRYQGTPMQVRIRNAKYAVSTLVLPGQLVEYLLIVCDKLKVGNGALQLGLSIACRFLRRRPNALPLQLVLLVSLLLASKLLQSSPPGMHDLHKWSCNSFTSKDFHRAERTILSELDFDLLSEGVPHCQVRMVTHCLQRILESDYLGVFAAIVEDLERLVWYYIYVGRVKMREGRDRLLTAALVHLALVFLTQFSGKFLQTLWACELTGVDERAVMALSNRLLKEILGEDAGKRYQL